MNKELVILIVGRFVQVLIMLVSIKVSTKLLNPSEMGNLYLVMSICSFFSFFFISPIGQYINRKTHEWHAHGQILNRLFNYLFYILFASILSLGIIDILQAYGIAHTIDSLWLFIAIPLFIFFNTWNQTLIPMINMLGNRAAFTILTILTLLTSLLASYLMIYYFKVEGIIWFLGQMIGLGIMTVVALYYFIRTTQCSFDTKIVYATISWKNIKSIISFALPLSIAVLFLWMQNQSYRIIIEKFIGAEFLGFLGVGIMIAIAIASSFETIVMQFLYPKMYQTMNDEILFQTTFSNIVNLILPIYFFLAVYVSFLAKYLITVLVDHQYASSFIFIIFGVWMEFFRMSSSLLSTIGHAKMKTSVLVVPYALGGIVAFVGTYIGSMTLYYDLLIPSLLVIAGGLTFITMFIRVKKMIFIDLHVKNFLLFLPYIGGLFLVLFAWQYADNFFISLSIIGASGLWFLFGLYRFLKFRGMLS